MLPALILTLAIAAASGILEEASSNSKQAYMSTNEQRGLPVVGDTWGPVFTQAPYIKQLPSGSIAYLYYYYYSAPTDKLDKQKKDSSAGYIKPSEKLQGAQSIQYYWPSPTGKLDKQDSRAGYVKPSEKLQGEQSIQYYWPSPPGEQAGYVKRSDAAQSIQYYWPSPTGKLDKQESHASYIKPSEKLQGEQSIQYYWPSQASKQDSLAGYMKSKYYWPSTKGKQELLAGQVKPSEIFTTKEDLDEYILSTISDDKVVVQLDPANLEGKYLEVVSSKVIPADAVKMVCHSYKTRPAFCHGLAKFKTDHNFKVIYSMVRDVDNGNLSPAIFTSHKGCAQDNGPCYWLTHVSEIAVLDKQVI